LFVKSIALAIFQQKDPIRENQPMYMQGWFLMRRAYHQVYRNVNATLVDLSLNFLAGIFISIAIQKFGYIGGNPAESCSYVPLNIAYQCASAIDQLREAGMFISLGILFSGISVAGNTFGREKVVYWRDTSSGMSAIPYFFAKVLVDVPRIILGSTMFSVALVMFFPYAQSFLSLYLIVMCLHFYAFALGYALSTAVAYSSFAVYGTGFSLLWALVLSGVVPPLYDILPGGSSKDGYPGIIQWLWQISGPRWAIEAFYIEEIKSLPFIEKTRGAPHMYNFNNYGTDIKNVIFITAGWLFLTILGLKLFNRMKQK